MVDFLMETGEVVAVTGDGTNDTAALSKADIGLAMGKCGTELAKMTSDIVILDDNFQSIVFALKWGRCVYDNIRSFLVYQLVVNFATTLVIIVSGIFFPHSSLKPIQILWVSLINGPFAAFAFSTSKPRDSLLDRAPYGRSDSVVNNVMIRDTILNTTYQLLILFILLFAYTGIFGFDEEKRRDTVIFNCFVYFVIFNLFNCRVTSHQGNPFEKIWKCNVFLIIVFLLLFIQFIFSQYCGLVFLTVPIGKMEWLASIGFGLSIIPIGFVIRLFKTRDLTVPKLQVFRDEQRKQVQEKYKELEIECMWDND